MFTVCLFMMDHVMLIHLTQTIATYLRQIYFLLEKQNPVYELSYSHYFSAISGKKCVNI